MAGTVDADDGSSIFCGEQQDRKSSGKHGETKRHCQAPLLSSKILQQGWISDLRPSVAASVILLESIYIPNVRNPHSLKQ